jgi:phage-related minor tail protein
MSEASLGSAVLDLDADPTNLNKSLKDAEKTAGDSGSKIGDILKVGIMAGAAAAGVAIIGIGAAALSIASDTKQASSDMQASLGLTAEEATRMGKVAQTVFKDNFAGSVQEAGQTLGEVRKQLGALADEELIRATENAFRLKDVFGVETPESIDAVNTLMTNFGLTSDQAFDFLAKGFQSGLDRSGDFLDTIGEYSTQFANGGADAGEFFSLMESGLQGGMLGTDKAADAFKEFRVRIQDGSTATASSLELLGIDSDDLINKMSTGQVTAADAFQLVLGKLRDTDDSTRQMQAGVGLLGTQFEDLGTGAALALDMTGTKIEDLAGATTKLDAKYNNFGSLFEGVKRKALVGIAPIGEKLLELANSAIPLVEDGINRVTSTFTWLGDNINIVGPILGALAATIAILLLPTLWAWVAAQWAIASAAIASAAATALAMAPVILIALAIGAAIALVALAWTNNWGDIQGKVKAVWAVIQPVLQAVFDKMAIFWEEIQPKLKQVWANIQDWIGAAMTFVNGVIRSGMQILNSIWDNHWQTIMSVLSGVWEMIQGYVEIAWSIVSGIIDIGLNLLSGNWDGAWNAMLTMMSGVWEGIKSVIGGAWAAIEGIFSLAQSAMGAAATAIGNAIKDGIINGIKGTAGMIGNLADELLNALKSLINSAIDMINWAIPDELGFDLFGTWVGIDLPDNPLPHLAKGVRNFAGGMALVGEEGPELVSLPRGANVYSNRELGNVNYSDTIVIQDRAAAAMYLESRRDASLRRLAEGF